MNTIQAEVLGMKKGHKHVTIKINGAPTFAAKLLTAHSQREQKEGFVEVWVDVHGHQRFIGYQNPYSVYKLVKLLYSKFMDVFYVEGGANIDMERWVEENTILDFDDTFETVDMDL